MKLINSTFGSVGHSLALTLKAAREAGDNFIDIPFGEYHVYKEDSEHTVLCVSKQTAQGFWLFGKKQAEKHQNATELFANAMALGKKED